MTRPRPNLLARLIAGLLAGARRLGFRWAFPIGTLAVPYHPLVVPLALLTVIGAAAASAWAALSGVAEGGMTWVVLLALAGVLGLLMSLPVIVWFVAMLGGRLIQAVMILAAMVLIAIECSQGRLHPAWSALPAGYGALFALQTLLGPLLLRRLQREQARFAPHSPGQSAVALADFDHSAAELIKTCQLAQLYCPALRGTIKAKRYHWLAAKDAIALTQASGNELPPGWKLDPFEHGTLLTREAAGPPRSPIVLRRGPYRAPLWLVTGLRRIEAAGRGGRIRVLHGEARTVRPIPLFNLFRFTSISGPGHNQWIAGFPRRKQAELSKPEGPAGRDFALLFPVRAPLGGVHDDDGLPELFAEVAAVVAERAATRERAIANLPAFWATVAHGDPTATRGDRDSLQVLETEPALLRGEDAAPTLDWFERARDARAIMQLLAAARLIEAFPPDLLAPHRERIETVFNSQKLALQWRVSEVPDRSVLPRETPLFMGSIGGFGLFLARPQLYARLAALSPKLARVEAGLQRELAQGAPGLAKSFTLVLSNRAAIG